MDAGSASEPVEAAIKLDQTAQLGWQLELPDVAVADVGYIGLEEAGTATSIGAVHGFAVGAPSRSSPPVNLVHASPAFAVRLSVVWT